MQVVRPKIPRLLWRIAMDDKQIFFGDFENEDEAYIYWMFDFCHQPNCDGKGCYTDHLSKDDFLKFNILFAYRYDSGCPYYNTIIIFEKSGKLYKIEEHTHCYCCNDYGYADFSPEEINLDYLKNPEEIFTLKDRYGNILPHKKEVFIAWDNMVRELTENSDG